MTWNRAIPILMLLMVGVLALVQVVNPKPFASLQRQYLVYLGRLMGFQVNPEPLAVGEPERVVRRWGAIALAVTTVLAGILLRGLLL